MNFAKLVGQADVKKAMNIFNGCVVRGELLYKPFADEAAFAGFFADRTEFEVINLITGDGLGFTSGCYVREANKAYITIVAVDPSVRRRGYGRMLLAGLESELKSLSNSAVSQMDVIFFNPMNFSWIVPNTDDHDHPNAPGVDVGSDGYIFLKNCGYRDVAYQNSYHVDLGTYYFPEEINARIASLKEKGIEIVCYDKTKHTGLEELFDNLGNEMWRHDIMTNVSREDGGDPVLIVSVNGRAMGFTGPLSVQPSGRGYFCGIGVHSDCRGNGAGKVLFSYLCQNLKDMGARFMTLFTGETNPARNIYEAAGFKIVRTWSDMKKI